MDIHDVDCVIVAIAHSELRALDIAKLMELFGGKKEQVIIDVKGLYSVGELEAINTICWRL